MPTSTPILVLVRDLLFSSRITAAARAQNVATQLLRDPALLKDLPGRMLLVDLNLAGAIEAAADWMRQTAQPVIGFVSHVDAATIAAARQAGLTQVMPRSRFVETLDQLLEPTGK